MLCRIAPNNLKHNASTSRHYWILTASKSRWVRKWPRTLRRRLHLEESHAELPTAWHVGLGGSFLFFDLLFFSIISVIISTQSHPLFSRKIIIKNLFIVIAIIPTHLAAAVGVRAIKPIIEPLFVHCWRARTSCRIIRSSHGISQCTCARTRKIICPVRTLHACASSAAYYSGIIPAYFVPYYSQK